MKTRKQENGNLETPIIGSLIDLRLKARMRDESLSAELVAHPDDDLIAAFVEGRLEDAESVSMISHLVSCATCLHLTADLIRFDPEMNEVGSASLPDQDPGPLERFFDRIAKGVIPSNEDAVFAYHEKDESTEEDKPEPTPGSQTET